MKKNVKITILLILIIFGNLIYSDNLNYKEIINLDKQIVPNMPSRNKLSLHFQIIDKISKLSIDEKFSQKEINKIIDISLRIVKINSSLLHKEIIPYILLSLTKRFQLKNDAKEFNKIIQILLANKKYRIQGDFKNLTKYYSKSADIFFNLNMDSKFIQVYDHLLHILFNRKKYSKCYYEALEALLKKCKKHNIT